MVQFMGLNTMQKLLSYTLITFIVGCGGMVDGAKVNEKDAKKNLAKSTDESSKSTPRPPRGNFCKMEDILRIVNENVNTIQDCFEKELAKDNKLSGKVVLYWNIWVNGEVERVRVFSSTLMNKEVENCMVSSLKHWKFPKPNGGICAVKFPFEFSVVYP